MIGSKFINFAIRYFRTTPKRQFALFSFVRYAAFSVVFLNGIIYDEFFFVCLQLSVSKIGLKNYKKSNSDKIQFSKMVRNKIIRNIMKNNYTFRQDCFHKL